MAAAQVGNGALGGRPAEGNEGRQLADRRSVRQPVKNLADDSFNPASMPGRPNQANNSTTRTIQTHRTSAGRCSSFQILLVMNSWSRLPWARKSFSPSPMVFWLASVDGGE